MEFPEIISMIDADLELLKKVRQLLASSSSSSSPSSGIQKKVKLNRRRAEQIRLGFGEIVTAEVEPKNAPETAEANAQELPAKDAAEAVHLPDSPGHSRRRHGNRALETSALRGAVPMGPVFVPAQVARPKNKPSVVVQSSVAVVPPTLTAEVLARQWLSRNNS
jgi:hypothetical protein